MRDVGEYLRAYRAYVSAKLGWGKALMGAFIWLGAMFVPLWAKAFVQLPTWLSITWMVAWGVAGLRLRALWNVEASPRAESEMTNHGDSPSNTTLQNIDLHRREFNLGGAAVTVERCLLLVPERNPDNATQSRSQIPANQS